MPLFSDEACRVKVNMYITEVEFDPKKQRFTLGGYFRQFWNDPRLAVDKKSQTVVLYYRDMYKDRQVNNCQLPVPVTVNCNLTLISNCNCNMSGLDP